MPSCPVGAVHRRELPMIRGRGVAQQEAAPVVGLDLEVAVGVVLPAVDNRDYRQAPRAQVEHVRLAFAAPAGTTVHTDLHDAVFPFDRNLQGAGHAPCAVRRCAIYLVMDLVTLWVRALATF